jgi:protease-4
METMPPSSPPPMPPSLPPTPPPLRPLAGPPARKSRGWMIVAIIACVLLGFSLLLNFNGLFTGLAAIDGSRTRGTGLKLDELVIKDNNARDKIAVIPVEGVISGSPVTAQGQTMVDVIKEQLKRAREDRRVKAVILRVDSPGGEVLASDEIHRALKEFQERTGKPVLAAMNRIAASGGYYVAAPCRYIMAHEMTITGSIGVIISTWNYRGLMDKVGVSPYTFKSGRFKDMLSGERKDSEIPADERALIDGWITEIYTKFKGIVREGRAAAAEQNDAAGRPLVANWEEFCDGRIFTGSEAQKLGFVDGLGNFDDAVDKTKELADIASANLIEYRLRHDLADLLGLFGSAESRAVKVDLGIDFPKLEAGRAYFLYLP